MNILQLNIRRFTNLSELSKQNICRLNTIFALSSGYGKCGVAVIRVSGKSAGEALKLMIDATTLPKPRYSMLKKIYHPYTKEPLDKGLVLWFPGPKSFTGEDCCEFQIHGGLAVISAVLNALQNIPDLRPAEPGEFTRRAFDNGKLDLTEVEGLSDLLQAETEMQRKQAFLQTNGSLKTIYNNWRSIMIKSVATVEAFIDFDETESLENDLLNQIMFSIDDLYKDITKHLKDGQKGEILRNGIKTVIVGEPNVGKSSLLNMLCERPAAIVTPIAGTTRDLLQVTLDINGYPLILTDTAGLRKETSDLVEQEGIKRAIESVQTANLIIFVVDAINFINWRIKYNNENIEDYFKEYLSNMGLDNIQLQNKEGETHKYLYVLNKSDLLTNEQLQINYEICKHPKLSILSCKNKDGLINLVDKLTQCAKQLSGTPSEDHPCMNKERHRFLLNLSSKYLEQFLSEVKKAETQDVVIMAQHLRSALRQLGKLTGNVTTEELLDVIFKDFCIGK